MVPSATWQPSVELHLLMPDLNIEPNYVGMAWVNYFRKSQDLYKFIKCNVNFLANWIKQKLQQIPEIIPTAL